MEQTKILSVYDLIKQASRKYKIRYFILSSAFRRVLKFKGIRRKNILIYINYGKDKFNQKQLALIFHCSQVAINYHLVKVRKAIGQGHKKYPELELERFVLGMHNNQIKQRF
jgi:hypothetical protein